MILSDLHTQLFLKPEVPVADFTDQTIIATVSNVGLGKEACKYFVRMNAARVIATVRNESRRLSALRELEKETGRKGIVELWELDYGRYDSVLVFGERVKKALQRLDKVVLNAGVATWNWELLEEHESTIMVNVISTTLLACLLLSVLQRSARLNGSDPALSIVSSGVNAYAQFNEHPTCPIGIMCPSCLRFSSFARL